MTASRWGCLAGIAGATLGILAGAVQWAFGSEIPEWTGDKLHPVQLGIITIALSLIALAAVIRLDRDPPVSTTGLLGLVAAVLGAALICFTTVGRLWYLPGPLLIIAAGLLLAAPRGAPPRAGR
jgi:hypothetical protein